MTRRFGSIAGGDEGVFPSAQHPTLEEGKVLSNLEKSRTAFFDAVMEYKKLLEKTTLAKQMSQAEANHQQNLFAELNRTAGELEQKNAGEAHLALCLLALNSSFSLRDRINDLAHKELMLYKKIERVEQMLKEKEDGKMVIDNGGVGGSEGGVSEEDPSI